MGNYKVVGKGLSFVNTKFRPLMLLSAPHVTKAATSMVELIIQLCSALQLAVFLSRGDGAVKISQVLIDV